LETTGAGSGNISGAGASAGISAVGAAASVSGTMVENSNTVAGSNFGPVVSTVTNNGGVLLSGGALTAGELSGAAASASLSAIGAQASAAATSIGSQNDMADFQTVGQTVTNSGAVSVTATVSGSLTAGVLSGNAASAQMGATGASGSVSATMIASGTNAGNGSDFGVITQNVVNSGPVTVTGTVGAPDVSVGEISGIAA
jgi:hypothetical protein